MKRTARLQCSVTPEVAEQMHIRAAAAGMKTCELLSLMVEKACAHSDRRLSHGQATPLNSAAHLYVDKRTIVRSQHSN